jgi:hypothetical protein
MAGYSKDFLIDAFLSRYLHLGLDKIPAMRNMAEKHYDEVGRDKFRVSASLDAEALRKFKLDSGRKS